LKSHSDPLHAATTVGRAGFITICSVVVCKRLLVDTPLGQDDLAYLFTFRSQRSRR
jgi:hypothetical protein